MRRGFHPKASKSHVPLSAFCTKLYTDAGRLQKNQTRCFFGLALSELLYSKGNCIASNGLMVEGSNAKCKK